MSGRILLVLCSFLPLRAGAATLVEVLASAERQKLAEQPTWRRLLHFEGGADESSVLDANFFLDPQGRSDPRAELMATLRAYFERKATWNDEHPRCRFPARYYWLASKLELPDYSRRVPECAKLESWALFDQTKSISMMLVSGYLGNPASTFGHSLVRFNSDAPDDRSGLFDLALNFGALVPENENPILYIFRGLSGRYEAGFSDKYFYTQDLVYSRTEFRDIWEYRLDLSEFQRTLLILHMWEIVGKKYRYFFTGKNCGYRMAELMQLVIEDEDLMSGKPWYAPVELFHRMVEVDAERRRRGRSPIVESVRYVPSSRRQLRHDLAILDDDEMDALNRYAESEPGHLPELLRTIPEERRTIFLDGLLAHQHYRLAVDRPDSADAAWIKNRELLIARMSLPPAPRYVAEIPHLSSPADGFRPAEISLSWAQEDERFESALLGISPFVQESVGQNSLEGNELAFLDLSVGYGEGSPALYLDRLDLLRILSLNGPSMRVSGDRGVSWKLRLGVDRLRTESGHDYDGVFNFGAGRAWQLGRPLTFFFLLNARAHTDAPIVRAQPELGLVIGLGRLRGRAGFGMLSTDYSGEFQRHWETSWMLRLSRQHAIQFDAREAEQLTLRVGFSRFF